MNREIKLHKVEMRNYEFSEDKLLTNNNEKSNCKRLKLTHILKNQFFCFIYNQTKKNRKGNCKPITKLNI